MPPDTPAIHGKAAIPAFLESVPPFAERKQVRLEMDGFADLAHSQDV